MVNIDWRKTFIFGAISGATLLLLSWLFGYVFEGGLAKIQFAFINQPLTVAIPGAQPLGTKFMTVITTRLGLGLPNIVTTSLIAIIGGGLSLLVGRGVYSLLNERFNLWTPKSRTGKVALLLFYSGIISGILLSFLAKSTTLPTFATAIVLALSSVLTAFILGGIMQVTKQEKYLPV